MKKHNKDEAHPLLIICYYFIITVIITLGLLVVQQLCTKDFGAAAPQKPSFIITTKYWKLDKYSYEIAKLCQQKEVDRIIAEYNERYKYFNVYDIPLSSDLQKYIYDVCIEYGIESQYDTIIALIWHESNFSSQVISSTNDYGLMQINKINHERLSSTLGITNFLNPYENISAGIYMLADLYNNYGATNLVLMSYNFGEGKAKQLWRNGVYSSQYYRDIMEKKERLTVCKI